MQDALSTVKGMVKTEVVCLFVFLFQKSSVDSSVKFCTLERKNESEIQNTEISSHRAEKY